MSDRQTDAGVKLAKFNENLTRRNITAEQWDVLRLAIFPAAETPESIFLAVDYCKSRGLDVMKKPVHIVPVWSKRYNRMIDTVWPGITEIRTTAARTREFAGRDATVFGPDKTETLGGAVVTFPEWAQVTVYRLIHNNRCAFVGPKVLWKETYATAKKDTDAPNAMWCARPSGQIEKCAEAAALRAAFPEEIGGDYAAEEINPFFEARDVTPTPEPRDRASKKPTDVMRQALLTQLQSSFAGDNPRVCAWLADKFGIIVQAPQDETALISAIAAIETKGDVDEIANAAREIINGASPEQINETDIPQ